jgi:hypothetical protein
MNKVITRLNKMGVRDTETGCLRWTGAKNPKGYGRQWDGNRVQQVHRLAYEAWVGPIPDGYEIDHVYERGCRHRDCYEPTHLEAVTHAENIGRRTGAWKIDNRKKREWNITHCPHGHEYTTENQHHYKYTYKGEPRVGIKCRTCRAGYKQRKKA